MDEETRIKRKYQVEGFRSSFSESLKRFRETPVKDFHQNILLNNLSSRSTKENNVFADLRLKLEREKTVDYGKNQSTSQEILKECIEDMIVSKKELGLKYSTYFLAAYIFYRFLSKQKVENTKLLLVVASCLFIASKFEEIYAPSVGRIRFLILDNTFSTSDVIRMECIILDRIFWTIQVPTPYTMLRQFSQDFPQDIRKKVLQVLVQVSKYKEYTTYLPSTLAWSCLSYVLEFSEDFASERIFEETKQQLHFLHFKDLKKCKSWLSRLEIS